MANYANLLSTIAANIKAGNGVNATTGYDVETALDAMVASLGAGYQFMGVATPATTPGSTDVKQFYIASTPGTYTDFLDSGSDPLEVNDGEVAVLKYDTAWSKEVTGIAASGGADDTFSYSANTIETFDLYVDIPSGTDFILMTHGTSAIDIFRVYANVQVAPAISSAVGTSVITAPTDITKLIFYVRDAEAAGTLSVLVATPAGAVNLYNLAAKSREVSEAIKDLGESVKGTQAFTGAANVKVEDISIPAGTRVQMKMKTTKPFTRIAFGFNNTYANVPTLYQNFYNADSVDVIFDAPTDLTSLYLYLVTADDLNMDVAYELNTGAFIEWDEAGKYDDLVVRPYRFFAMDGTENSVYHSNWLKFMDGSFIVAPQRISYKNGWKFLERCVRTTAKPSEQRIQLRILEKVTHNQIGADINVPCFFGNPAVTTAKNVNVIGDSFTYNGTFYQHIADILSGLSFVGMRKSYAASDPLRAEGRGGWALGTFFQPHDDVTPTHMQPFSPFMHAAGYTYYGVIDFWKVIVNGTSQYTYGTNGFADYAAWFDSNGYKLNPVSGDLMYDGVNDKYVYFDGASWVDYDGTPDFEFDYGKYVSTWNIASPDIVLIELGKNDFQKDASASVFATWKSMMDEVLASIQAYATAQGKTVYVGICTPTTANEAPNNSDNNAAEVGGRNMWLARKQIIETYDTQAQRDAGVFVVDTGVCLDPVYGFELSPMLPFAWYAGDERELYDTNGVHPSAGGYKQIGTCMAGFIQYVRS